MPRVRKGAARARKHRKVLKSVRGHMGAASRRYRVAIEARLHAGRYATEGRKLKKRDFRQLWITRISAACRQRGITYSRFMHGLGQCEVGLNRKMLAEVAVADPRAFDELVAVASGQARVGVKAPEKAPATEKEPAKAPAKAAKPEKAPAAEKEPAKAPAPEAREAPKPVAVEAETPSASRPAKAPAPAPEKAEEPKPRKKAAAAKKRATTAKKKATTTKKKAAPKKTAAKATKKTSATTTRRKKATTNKPKSDKAPDQ